MFSKKPLSKLFMRSSMLLIASSILASTAVAQSYRVTVKIENVAPEAATFQTPVWVGLHDGQAFDTYNGNTPAGSRPIAGSVNALGQSAMEQICEDGATAQIAIDFASLQPNGTDTTVEGPNGGPIAPGEITEHTFTVDSNDRNTRFLSYASMVLPSNDFCISNANPTAHQIFDTHGNFVAKSFFVAGAAALDAGTEVNDELPVNTAFFGQAAPNTGTRENGVIGRIGVIRNDLPETGFISVNPGKQAVTILETERFAEANFRLPGYSFLKFTFSAEAVQDNSAYPVANTDTATVAKNVKGTFDVLSNDTGNGLQLTEVNQYTVRGGQARIVNNKIEYTPRTDYTGEDSFWYVFKDSRGRTNAAQVKVTVTKSGSDNSGFPIAITDQGYTQRNQSTNIYVLGNDTGSGLKITESNTWTAKAGRTTFTDDAVTYTPKAGFTGDDSFWYVFTDSQGRRNSAKVNVKVF